MLVVNDPELDTYVKYRYPRLVEIRRGRRLHDSHSFEAGREDGNRLVLHKGVHSRGGSSGRLLPK